MLNVICLKWGTLYSAEDVNRLKRMVKKNLTISHKFICVTEDPTDIDDDVEIISLPDNPKLKVWWNKLFLFKKEFLPKGRYLFFDLDLVIHNNIDDMANYDIDEICFVNKSWSPLSLNGNRNNSSVMLWETGMAEHIWDYFYLDKDYFVKEYDGIDGFIYRQGISFKTFPKEWIYSYLWGDHKEMVLDPNPKNRRIYYPEDMICKYKDEFKVCLFNSMKRNEMDLPFDKDGFKQHV